MTNISGTAWRKEIVNTAIVTIEKTNHDLKNIQSHLKPLMNMAQKSQKGLMIEIVKFPGKVRMTPDIVLLKLFSGLVAQGQGDVEKPHLFTFTFLRSSFYSVTVQPVKTLSSTSNLSLANLVQAARSFQYLTKSIQARLDLLKTFKATLDSRLGYPWSASSVSMNDMNDDTDLPELVDVVLGETVQGPYGIPTDEFERVRQMMKQEEKISMEREDDPGPYAELRRVFVMLNNTLIVVHKKLRKRFKKLYQSITLSNFETVLNQLNRLLLDLTTLWEHRFSTVYSAIYIYHQQPHWNLWLNCVNNLLLQAKEVNVEGVNWGTIIPILYKYVVSYGLAVGLCHELQQGWLQDYKLRHLINRLISFSNNEEHKMFFRGVLKQLESLCVVNKKKEQTGTLSCDETLQTAPLIMNEVAKLFVFMLTLKVPEFFPQSVASTSVTIWPLPTVPLDAQELLLSLAELEQVYKGNRPLRKLKTQQPNVSNLKATTSTTTTTSSYFQTLKNHLALHPVAYASLVSLALTTGMAYLWNYEGGERDYCWSRSRPLPKTMDPHLNKYFSYLENMCCAFPDNEVCKLDPLLAAVRAYFHYYESDHK